ncbi:SPOSA6832_00185 [Sporobolomyces salmonicolor]|uniref:SPOSA6832_00185-mRNA-1:cds n=1 Tax=Sporidiobolus salmonicolor TaxID=5005 RepID=A0A0D6EG26_SPOSA|nr:SPOSA6832_00185 [Sporobolomyces salmonicolor]
MPADRYYGFEDQARLCEHVITSLFAVGPQPTVGRPGIDTPPLSPKPGQSQVPQLGEFIAYALYRTRLPVSITHQALLLLTRLKARYPSARGTSTSPHRLFLSSLMLSSKISMDDTYSNKSWQVVGQGLFELKEVNQMERELFAFLGWNVVVRDEELAAWVEEVVVPYEAQRALATSLAAAAAAQQASRESMEDRKRRREPSLTDLPTPSPSPSVSRSPSPDTLSRHRRASDAAVALLHGSSMPAGTVGPRPNPPSTAAYDAAASTSTSPSPSRMARPFGHRGMHTPNSPCTPAGPLTPETATKAVWPAEDPVKLAAAAKVAPMEATHPHHPAVVDSSSYTFLHHSQVVDHHAASW